MLRRFKEMGFSLSEIGYPCPLDDRMATDLLSLDNYINEKRKREMEKNN